MLPRIERYEISNEIGHGGMATVYRARDKRLDRWVAVKVMHPHLRGTDEARARFAREARAVARLKHPAILEIYDYSDSDAADAYIATELLTGPTLKAFVDDAPELPAEVAAAIAMELARALAAAHAEGIVHRDVKPENVLLHQGRGIKLTDFGIADMLDPSMSHMTATGQLLGSPAHMAPEQVEGGDTDARSDVFAVGTILYWLATGVLPFAGKNPHHVLKRVAECNPTDPLSLRGSIGAPLCRIIMRCLRKEPSERFQSASELADALAAFLQELNLDPQANTFEAFLKDPSGEAARLRSHVLSHLLDKAQAAVARRDRPATIDCIDRVLALDDGNPRALALLKDLDRSTRRKQLSQAALYVAAAGVAAALWLAFTPFDSADQNLRPAATSTPRPAPSVPVSPPVASPPTPNKLDQTAPAPSARPRPTVKPKLTGPRTVVFAPEPANVTISVDGAPAKPFGPGFNKLELEPGRHSFHFVGAHSCCEDATLNLDIPGGPGETEVRAKLALRDARLYVTSNVPADVSLDGELVGRALSFIKVPLKRSLLENRKISVTAPGYAPYTGYVQLRAGQVAPLEVTLTPSASP